MLPRSSQRYPVYSSLSSILCAQTPTNWKSPSFKSAELRDTDIFRFCTTADDATNRKVAGSFNNLNCGRSECQNVRDYCCLKVDRRGWEDAVTYALELVKGTRKSLLRRIQLSGARKATLEFAF